MSKLNRMIATLLCSGFLNYVAAATSVTDLTATTIQSSAISANIPNILNKNIESDIINVYGMQAYPNIYAQIKQIIIDTKASRVTDLRSLDVSESSNWYQSGITYMFYAENFGTNNNQTNTFNDLLKMVPYLKGLGVNNVYILPFLDSPMKDSGFDVKDPTAIRPSLGNINQFKNFTNTLHKNGIKVSGDLVLNHLSDQNIWFQQALKGDKEKMDYFVYKDYLPASIRKRDSVRGTVVDYTNKDGSISSRRLIFPEMTPNHYRKVTINGKNYYFYHTFYPFQIDLNWQNPKVLYEMLKVVGFWCNQGIDTFRLDAVPFLIKSDGTDGENSSKTHALINLISSFIQSSCPNSVLQAEAGQAPKEILPYFGKQESYTYSDLNKLVNITRTNEVQIAYNFPLMPALWSSMLFANSNYFWNVYNTMPIIPSSNAWTNFLRVHDELTLETTATPEIREALYKALINNGTNFREGLGVSGRMANFLDKDPQRISQAFAILMSLPGIPVIYYGDELGILNNWDYAKAKAIARKNDSKNIDKSSESSSFDSRDINRGPITYQSFQLALNKPNSYSGQIHKSLQHDISLRKKYPALSIGSISKITSNSNKVLAYKREFAQENIIVINNLSAQAVDTKLDFQLNGKTTFVDLRSGKKYTLIIKDNSINIKLKPYQTLWLTAK